MKNFKFIISYDGSRYFGWERQPGRDTIQGKLEAVLTRMCGTDVQVIGVPSKDYGEEIMACVILKEGETMTEEEVKDFVRTHMAKHKVPRYVEFVKEFPMNAAGKILKYKMREAAVQKLSLQAAEAIETA